MIRLLDGLALLKEVDQIDGVKYNSSQLKKMFPEHIVVMRHNCYIYKNFLCDVALENVTNLDDYIQLGELAEELKMHKKTLRERIDFMEKTGVDIFKYITVGGVRFINIDSELKYLFQNFNPFLASYFDADHLVHCKMMGDLKIGFY